MATKRVLTAMIIGLALNCSGWAGDEVRLPDSVTFAARLEAGDIALARSWLAAGLDPNFLGSRIGSGLMIGAWEGNLQLMALFLEHGADINRANVNGETPLALAAWNGRKDAVHWLLERGARINTGKRQWSALHYAVFAGHKDLARYLIEKGADINAQSTNGSTVLMMAVYEGHEDLARMIIEKGAQRSVKNDWGEGALEWAMRSNRLDLAQLIASRQELVAVVNEPKEKWGEPRRSQKASRTLLELLRMREIVVERGLSTQAIDNRISAERARIVRSELKRDALPSRAATLEISASRKAPQDQSANIVYDTRSRPQGYRVPTATFSGQPRMPAKTDTKPY